MLREHFKSVVRRSQSPSHEEDGTRREDTLDQGILQNVFIVIDEEAMYSTKFVWAVDPDYLETKTDEIHSSGHPDGQYRGFLAVQLGALLDNFFAVRKYQEDEYPMPALWCAAQREPGQAFESVDGVQSQPNIVGPGAKVGKRKRQRENVDK